MKIQNILWPALALVLAITLGAFLGNSRGGEESNVSIVKTYKLPPRRVREAKNALTRLFSSSKKASAQALGDGLLLVRIPKSFESGVDELIHKFNKTLELGDQKIRMDYWLLRGTNEKIAGNSRLSGPPGLQDVMEIIRESDGQQNLQLLEHLSSNSSLGSSVKVEGWISHVESSITPAQVKGEYALGLTYRSKFGEILTDTTIPEDSFVVIGQTATNNKKIDRVLKEKYFSTDAPSVQGENKIYFVIRARKI